MSARALPGRRLDCYRAGMMATAETEARKEEGPVLETGGTSNLTTDALTPHRAMHTDPNSRQRGRHGRTRMNSDQDRHRRTVRLPTGSIEDACRKRRQPAAVQHLTRQRSTAASPPVHLCFSVFFCGGPQPAPQVLHLSPVVTCDSAKQPHDGP